MHVIWKNIWKSTYNDSSNIFGNGICCEKISSSNESVEADIDVAIKWANFQHCTVSGFPCFSATVRLCSHISTKLRNTKLKQTFVENRNLFYLSNYPNQEYIFQPISCWFPKLWLHRTRELWLLPFLQEHFECVLISINKN